MDKGGVGCFYYIHIYYLLFLIWIELTTHNIWNDCVNYNYLKSFYVVVQLNDKKQKKETKWKKNVNIHNTYLRI